MSNKEVIFILLSISIFLFITFKIDIFGSHLLINVQGRAEHLVSNTQEFGLNNFSSVPIKESRIIAVNGKVKAKSTNISIPIKRLSNKKLITQTNSDGIFTFRLKPGIYTFFIVQGNNAYLNSFDGKGYYKSHKVSSESDNILISVTDKSYF